MLRLILVCIDSELITDEAFDFIISLVGIRILS